MSLTNAVYAYKGNIVGTDGNTVFTVGESGGIPRHEVPQTGTWQFKITPKTGFLIIGKDDDVVDSAQFVRMVTGYGFPVVLNSQHQCQTNSVVSDVDGEYTTYPIGSISRFPSVSTINALNKVVLAQNLGEIALHGATADKAWDSSLLTGNVLDTFYATYTAGGGTKSKSDFKDAVIEKYADTDVEQGASRIATLRSSLETDIADSVDTIGMWGGTPIFTIDGIDIGATTPILSGTQKISRTQNYQGDGLLTDTFSQSPYYITRDSNGLTPAGIISALTKAYNDKRCIEVFHHYYLDGTKAKWDDFKTTMDTIKSWVDQGKIKVVTCKQYYELGEFAADPIVGLSLTTDELSYSTNITLTDSNFICKAILDSGAEVICGDDCILDYSDVDTSTVGTYTATLQYRGKTTSCSVVITNTSPTHYLLENASFSGSSMSSRTGIGNLSEDITYESGKSYRIQFHFSAEVTVQYATNKMGFYVPNSKTGTDNWYTSGTDQEINNVETGTISRDIVLDLNGVTTTTLVNKLCRVGVIQNFTVGAWSITGAYIYEIEEE